MACPKLCAVAAWITLIVFVVLAAMHVATLLRVVTPPLGAAFAMFPVLAFGQLVMIAGFNRFATGGRRRLHSILGSWHAVVSALRFVPLGWKALLVPVWFVYFPVTFFTRLYVPEDATTPRNDFLGLSVVLAALALVQFICLRYVIPKRAEILAAAMAAP